MKNRLFSTAMCIVMSLLLCCCRGDILEEAKILIQDAEYKEVVSIYKQETNEKIKAKIDLEINNLIEKQKNDYLTCNIAYSVVSDNLKILKGIEGCSDNAKETLNYIVQIEESRNAYVDAENKEKKKEYAEAIKKYKEVIQDDVENFEKANNKVKEIVEKLEKECILKVESSSIHKQDEDNKKEYPDMIQTTIVNKSDKKVKDLAIAMIGYDKDGKSVKIDGKNTEASYVVMGLANNVNLEPNEKFGESEGFQLVEKHGIYSTKSIVKSATLEDGTNWTNPLYNKWLDDNLNK